MFDILANGRSIYEPGTATMRLISPKLTLEIGKAGSLQFGLPPNNDFYTSDIQQLKTNLVVQQDGDEIFRGRVLSKKRNFNNIIDIYGEGDLAYLVDSVQKGKKFKGKSHDLFKSIIKAHNSMIGEDAKKFTVGNITVENRDVLIVGQSEEDDDIYENAERTKFNPKQIAINSIADEWQNTFDYIESCLIDYCGGYLRTRRVGNTTYIDWIKDSDFGTTTQVVEFGKNILDLTEEFNAEEAFSVLVPIGDDNLTVEKAAVYNSNGITHAAKSVEVVDTAAVAKFGRIVKSEVFDGVTEPVTLLENAVRYLKANTSVPITIEVRAVDLHLVDPGTQTISLGDKVKIVSPGHSIDRNDLFCTKIEYDLANPGNTTYTFGNPKQTLTERYRKDKKKQDETAARSGGGGGGGAGEAVEENAKVANKEFFREWIEYDPNDQKAYIQLGSLYGYIFDDKEINVSKSLITLDSDKTHSALDLYAEHTRMEDNIAKLKTWCGIDLNADDQEGKINIFAHAKDTQEHIAAIKVWAGYDSETGKYGSRIALKAEVMDLETDIFNVNSSVINLGKDLDKVEVRAKNLEIKVDQLDIDGLVDITGAVTVSNGAVHATIEAKAGSTYYISGVSAGFSEHYHKLTCDSNGKVTSGGCTWGSDNSFNMADTTFYKKAKVNRIDYDVTEGNRYYTIDVSAKNQYGTELKHRTIKTDNSIYFKGYDAVRVDYLEERSTGVRVYLTNGHSQFYSGWHK